MKKNVMFLGMMMMSTIIFAQRQQGDPNAMATRRSERMKKELSLSDDQYTKVKTVNMKFAERYAGIRADASLTQGTARAQMEKLKVEQETQLKGVLTADQWTKYAAMKAKHGEERKKHHRGKPEKG